MRLAIVPGHRPSAPGAGANGLHEYPVVSTLADTVQQFATPTQHTIRVVRRPQNQHGLRQLIRRLNSGIKADAILSLHLNAAEAESPNKSYAIHNGERKAAALADALHGVELPGVERIDPKTRDDLAILNDTQAVAVLDEVGYVDRADHRKKILRNLIHLSTHYAEAIEKWTR